MDERQANENKLFVLWQTTRFVETETEDIDGKLIDYIDPSLSDPAMKCHQNRDCSMPKRDVNVAFTHLIHPH